MRLFSFARRPMRIKIVADGSGPRLVAHANFAVVVVVVVDELLSERSRTKNRPRVRDRETSKFNR